MFYFETMSHYVVQAGQNTKSPILLLLTSMLGLEIAFMIRSGSHLKLCKIFFNCKIYIHTSIGMGVTELDFSRREV